MNSTNDNYNGNGESIDSVYNNCDSNIFYIVICVLNKPTAGSAKKDIAKTLKHDATIFPIHVWGTASPYPIVVTVIWNQIIFIIITTNLFLHA